jgi:hypothetical protein
MCALATGVARRGRLGIAWRWLSGSPVALLAVVCVLSLGARVAWLGGPCRAPCVTASDHVLIFDEDYYVNAARAIAGIRPATGSPYDTTPLGDDGNSEHPQLAKLVIAGSIELLGDGPLAWRLGSLVAGAIAILGMFALVRAAGGGPWVALGAAALMAADNLMLVHGRIGTLDVYALAAMVWGAALYVGGRPLLAGVVIGVGACAKEVAPYVLIVLALLEALRLVPGFRLGRGPAGERPSLPASAGAGAWRLIRCGVAAFGSFVGLLWLMGLVAPPYNPETGKRVSGGPFGHISHILDYASHQTSPHGPRGIASYPWGWLGDYKPITYLNVNPSRPTSGLEHVHPAVHFLGMISPPILLAGLLGVGLAAWRVVRGRAGGGSGAEGRGSDRAEGRASGSPPPARSSEIPILSLAWFAGTYVPFVLLSLIWQRTSYIYYMLIVMPGLYVAASWLMLGTRRLGRLKVAWVAGVVVAVVVMYPFTPLP